jgi:(2R)-ethylmalonyl-CoA mutase
MSDTQKTAEQQGKEVKRDRPWMMRTYSGHSSARASNELYRKNLSKGQTGLSVAFDLPTQTGYDSDHPLARGEVGKVGVPISCLDDMDVLFDQLPLEEMNTSMTINATAAWLMALYVALAERRGVSPAQLRGTTQNDIIKEYLSRGTYIFPPRPSLRLIVDTVAYSVDKMPKWNPINVCSYHLQEAGAAPVQELAFALGTAQAVLDAVRESGQVPEEKLPTVVGRISFFVNAGIRFIEEACKMRAFTRMWDEMARDRYGVKEAKLRRFRYGVQVNSLGLTEQQPENNVQRIVLEMLGVVLSRSARARAVQLPAWNEALGLPRPWDQQWALRIQQVVAHETDLLEYADIFDGSSVIEEKVGELVNGALSELSAIAEQGGMIEAVESGYVKRELVRSNTERMRAIERGELKIVGVNCFNESEESPLTARGQSHILKVDPSAEREQIERLKAHRQKRNEEEVNTALQQLEDAAKSGSNIVLASIRCAQAGVTTGEWGMALRSAFGEYRPASGVDITTRAQGDAEAVERLRGWVRTTSNALGRPLKLLVGKPGLDGHSNGAEQIAVKARDVGIEVVYEGIRLTPEQIAISAQEEGVHAVGLSVLSGSHLELSRDVIKQLEQAGVENTPVVVGGIVPTEDSEELLNMGVAAVYTPKDSDLNSIMSDLVELVRRAHGLGPLGG